MNKVKLIKDYRPKDDVSDVFLVKYLARVESRDGKSYLNVILADASGDLEARKWSDAEIIEKELSKGDYVHVEGKINLYQQRLQIIIKNITKLDAKDINSESFIPKSNIPVDEMLNELECIIEGLADVYIKELLLAILYDSDVRNRLKTAWAGKTIHHAYSAGLLEHLLSCAKLAISLSSHYKVNVNYVVAGAILHDICKIYELTDGPVVDYTEEGKLVGHLVKGVELIEFYAHKIQGIPQVVKNHLKHIIVAHHGTYEHGSPKLPQTMEAQLVHLIDLMDSKMSSFVQVIQTDKTPGKWSGFVKHLDRIIYKDELPTFTQTKQAEENEPLKKEKIKTAKREQKELTHSMSKLLEGFKVEDN